jgi:Concanavalin A-like lectin/glucanases superfamily
MTLVAEWGFDNFDITDDSERGHNGTPVNGPTFPAGYNDIGIQFASASSQYATVPDHADFAFTTQWTFMCRLYLASGGTGEFVCKRNQWWFSCDTSSYYHGFYRTIGGTDSCSFGTAPVTGTWNHLCARNDGSALSIYLNGSSYATGVSATHIMASGSEPVRMGSWEGTTEFLNGLLDDVRLFNNYLPDDEMLEWMNRPVHPKSILVPAQQAAMPAKFGAF